MSDVSGTWDSHWRTRGRGGLFGRVCEFFRLNFIAKAVDSYMNAYFPEEGVFVDLGCGSSQTSTGVRKKRRVFVGFDISTEALRASGDVPAVDLLVNADVKRIPFRDGSIDGVWNLGVMEHFTDEESVGILEEVHRVLKPGAYALLFWIPQYSSSRFVLGPVEWLLSVFGFRFTFFPSEPGRIRSHSHLKSIFDRTRLELVKDEMTFRDAFIYLVVVCRKKV